MQRFDLFIITISRRALSSGSMIQKKRAATILARVTHKKGAVGIARISLSRKSLRSAEKGRKKAKKGEKGLRELEGERERKKVVIFPSAHNTNRNPLGLFNPRSLAQSSRAIGITRPA